MEILASEFARQLKEASRSARPLEARWEIRESRVPLGRAKLRLRPCGARRWPRRWGLSVARWFPREAGISAVRLGDLAILSWPGEPTSELGFAARAAALEAGAGGAWLLGLTNDHLAYFTTSGEYERGGYEACASLYGPDSGERIAAALGTLARELFAR